MATLTKSTVTKTATTKATGEKLFECEVKRRRVAARGGYEPFWKIKNVADALVDGDTEFRCKDCHGTVKLHKQRVATGPASHAEHSHKLDSEYCPSGFYFLAATDGREPRLSEKPVR
jgi:hypothetical protein